MPNWDEDSPQLRVNLALVSRQLREDARALNSPDAAMALHWHQIMMAGLSVPNPSYVGAFRGSEGLERVNVRVGENVGVAASKVKAELQLFELKRIVSIRNLDTRIAQDAPLTRGLLQEVIELCAWAHAEWVRVHPFANGSGRPAGSGRTTLQCVTACPRLLPCVRGRSKGMAKRERQPCGATRDRPKECFGCFSIPSLRTRPDPDATIPIFPLAERRAGPGPIITRSGYAWGKTSMDNIDDTKRRKGELEALLFASSRPLSTRVLARNLDLSEERTLVLLGNFASDLAHPGRGLQLREIAGTWRLETKPHPC